MYYVKTFLSVVAGIWWLLVGVLVIAMPQAVQAQTAQDLNEAQTQQDMVKSAAADYRVSDNALNDAWTSAKSFADAIGQGAAAQEAQDFWLGYRDAACDVQASPYLGGTLHAMALSECLTSVTKDRTRMLLEFHGY